MAVDAVYCELVSGIFPDSGKDTGNIPIFYLNPATHANKPLLFIPFHKHGS
jgi:hypothetical protein